MGVWVLERGALLESIQERLVTTTSLATDACDLFETAIHRFKVGGNLLNSVSCLNVEVEVAASVEIGGVCTVVKIPGQPGIFVSREDQPRHSTSVFTCPDPL